MVNENNHYPFTINNYPFTIRNRLGCYGKTLQATRKKAFYKKNRSVTRCIVPRA